MADIPYGDYFSVEMRFDVVRGAKPNTCEVSVTMSVPFSKKTVFTSRIKQGAREDSLKQYEQAYVRMARQELARARAPAVSSHTSVGAVAKVEDLPEEWRETVQGMLKVRVCRISNRNPLTEISSSYVIWWRRRRCVWSQSTSSQELQRSISAVSRGMTTPPRSPASGVARTQERWLPWVRLCMPCLVVMLCLCVLLLQLHLVRRRRYRQPNPIRGHGLELCETAVYFCTCLPLHCIVL
jgi:hypothetical protein